MMPVNRGRVRTRDEKRKTSAGAKTSAEARRCKACGRGGGIVSRTHRCRYCGAVDL
jgi:hypothetical protein